MNLRALRSRSSRIHQWALSLPKAPSTHILARLFVTVNHSILLYWLEKCVGIKGTALKWSKSYLTTRSFSVQLDKISSSLTPLSRGVPQGSILGPLLFSLYMLPLGSIFKKYNISFHCFVDNVQIDLPLKTNNTDSLQPLLNCLRDLKIWLDLNFPA